MNNFDFGKVADFKNSSVNFQANYGGKSGEASQKSSEIETKDSYDSGLLKVIITSQNAEELAEIRERIAAEPKNKIQKELSIINGFSTEIDLKTLKEVSSFVLNSKGHATIFQDKEHYILDVPETSEQDYLSNVNVFSMGVGENPSLSGLSDKPSILDIPEIPQQDYQSTEDVSRLTMGIEKLHAKGITGKGQTICVIDSGIIPHPDFEGRIKAYVDIGLHKPEMRDEDGHGTFCAGLAAGSGKSSGGKFVGAAPEAEIVAVRVLGKSGKAITSRVIEGIQWAVENKEKYGINIITMSIGDPAGGISYKDDPTCQALEKAVEAGIHVYVCSGNYGKDAPAGTVSVSGSSPNVTTVGAFDDQKTVSPADDKVPPFSGRGPTVDGEKKPDIVAPGVRVISTTNRGGYGRATGTSMATPLAAGVGALLNQLCDNKLSGKEIKELMESTANKIEGEPVEAQGFGELNPIKAAEKIMGKPFDQIELKKKSD